MTHLDLHKIFGAVGVYVVVMATDARAADVPPSAADLDAGVQQISTTIDSRAHELELAIERASATIKKSPDDAKAADLSVSSANFRAGKLVRHGFTAGVALAGHFPVPTDHHQQASSFSSLPYLAVLPAWWWIQGSITKSYCAALWQNKDAQQSANDDAEQLASKLIADIVVPTRNDAEWLEFENNTDGNEIFCDTPSEKLQTDSASSHVRLAARYEGFMTVKEFISKHRDKYKLLKPAFCQRRLPPRPRDGHCDLYSSKDPRQLECRSLSQVDRADVVRALTGWDEELPGSCRLSWIPGAYVGIPASFTVNSIAADSDKVAARQFSPLISFGIAWAPISVFSLLGGLTFSTVKADDGRNYTVPSLTAGIGGNLDLVGLLFK